MKSGLIVLALVIPITAGMGLNFAVIIGVISAQMGFYFIYTRQINSSQQLFIAGLIALILSVIFGYIIAQGLNRVKGKEMIATIIIGFLGTIVYQFIFMPLYNVYIKSCNMKVMLYEGTMDNTFELIPYAAIMKKICYVKLGDINIPIFVLLVILLFCLFISLLMKSKWWEQFRVVGEEGEMAEELGINVNYVRAKAIVLSMVIACLGQIIFVQNHGMISINTGSLNFYLFSCAALLIGGATIKEAKVRHALSGVFLFYALSTISPQVGQKLFGNTVIGKHFIDFIAYGVIIVAFLLNIKSLKYYGIKRAELLLRLNSKNKNQW